jgi:beta-1,4-mannosyl-glycoprotein beta-1,4-N-acetylglucosaminyltransferase
MKIYDCTTFYSEHMMLDVRFNILDEHVHKFVVVESLYSHSGEKKNLNFDINNYPKFKDKIIYLVIDHEPRDLIEVNSNTTQQQKRINSLKRIELSYDYMKNAIDSALDDDLIILSDNDEIPNLRSEQFKKDNNKILIFEQLFFYYKFNLLYDRMSWFGSKACKKKYLKSFSWLRNQKNKKYPFWRVDTYFSKLKNTNLRIIKDGGWHFTNIKSPQELFKKMKNFGHHDEFDLSGLTVEDLKKKIENKKVFYNHFADKENLDKWNFEYDLKIISDKLLPTYLSKNKEKYREWFE